MSIENVVALLEKADQDPSLQSQIAQWQNDNLDTNIFCVRMIALGEQHGLDFSQADVEAVLLTDATSSHASLSTDELDSVVGGAGLSSLFRTSRSGKQGGDDWFKKLKNWLDSL